MSGRRRSPGRPGRSRNTPPCRSPVEKPDFDSSPFDPRSGGAVWDELPSGIYSSPRSRTQTPKSWLSEPYPSTSAGSCSPASSRSPWSSPGLGSPRPGPSKRSTGCPTDYDEEEEIRVINEILAGSLFKDPRLPAELRRHIPAGATDCASPVASSSTASPMARKAMSNLARSSGRSPAQRSPASSSSPRPHSSNRSTGCPPSDYDEAEEIGVINEILAGGLLGNPLLPNDLKQHIPVDTLELPPWVPHGACPRLEGPNNPPPMFRPLLDSRWRMDLNLSEEHKQFVDTTASFKHSTEDSPYEGIYEYGKLTEFNAHNIRNTDKFFAPNECDSASNASSARVVASDEVFGDPYEALAREVGSVPEKSRKDKHLYFQHKKKLEMFKELGMVEGQLESMEADPWSGDEDDADEWFKSITAPGDRLKLFEKFSRTPYYVDENNESHVVDFNPTAAEVTSPCDENSLGVSQQVFSDQVEGEACSSDDSFTTACDDHQIPRGFCPEFGQEMEFPGGPRDSEAFEKFIHSWAPVGNSQDGESVLNTTFVIPDPLTAGSDSDPCSDTSDNE